jgi:hypothetical protein
MSVVSSGPAPSTTKVVVVVVGWVVVVGVVVVVVVVEDDVVVGALPAVHAERSTAEIRIEKIRRCMKPQ